MFIGAHTSIAGGTFNALYEAKSLEANSMQIFTANQRQWDSRPISELEQKKFKEAKAECKVEKILSHNSYLINIGSSKEELLLKSKNAFIEEILRCKNLGIDFIVFHPGAAVGYSEEECLNTIASSLISFKNHLEDTDLVLLLESTAGQGSNVGYKFEHISQIINETKSYIPIGVCLDTCHIYSAGYDIKNNFSKVLDEFEKKVGLNYLKAIHVNDTKTDFNSRRDRHENLGKGFLGLEPFKFLMREERVKNTIKILETPLQEFWKDEIKLLKSFV
ncbi:MAG: hypothetical protein A2888_01035 [Chlamydiae bacterium RIFCSPLOWO2_01_FULL_28_7]|nr:MAG: hypothetical protein A2888_01035 [Chlamydiae bacterium RIFCSPLOWO2_01_FULL_28_7]